MGTKLGIGMADKIVFINIQDIIYLEAQGAYSKLHLGRGVEILSSRGLGEFEKQLPGSDFYRIHNTYLINLNRLKEIRRNNGGSVLMENDKELNISQRKRKDFLNAVHDTIF